LSNVLTALIDGQPCRAFVAPIPRPVYNVLLLHDRWDGAAVGLEDLVGDAEPAPGDRRGWLGKSKRVRDTVISRLAIDRGKPCQTEMVRTRNWP
jgi:hypothetical protein